MALHSAVVASSAAERMLAESIARHSQTSSNSATTHANSGGNVRLGSGSVSTRAGSATAIFTEAMLMRRAAAPPAANDSTLADVIARYSANVPSPQQQPPRPQPQAQPATASPEQQSQQQRDQQQQAGAQAVQVRLVAAAAAPANAPAGGLPAPPPSSHVSWNLPPRGAFAQHTAQQPDPPSTVTSPGSSWRERDARRSGDSSSSGEYPGRYIRSLPMLLSIAPVVADGPDVVSDYLDSMRRHFEGREQQQSAEKSAGQPGGRTASVALQSSTEYVLDPGAGTAGNGATESLASETSSSRELRLQSLSSGSITAASRLCGVRPSWWTLRRTPCTLRSVTCARATACIQCGCALQLSHCCGMINAC